MTATPHRREVAVPGIPAPNHYTDAVAAGGLLFISGQVGYDVETQAVPEDVTEQARLTFVNIQRILATEGLTFADVVRVNVLLTDIGDAFVINPVREEFFGATRPASTLVQVGALLYPQLKIEIEVVAAYPTA